MTKTLLTILMTLSLAGKGKDKGKAVGQDEELLRLYQGRWELVGPEGRERIKAGKQTPTCVLRAADVEKARGAAGLKETRAALDELYAIKDKLQTAMLFRQVEPSEEIVGIKGGEEFLIEKMFSTRESLERVDQPKGDKAFALLKELARGCKS